MIDETVDRVLGIFTFGYRLDVLLLLTDCRPQARQSHDCFPIAASSVAVGGTAFYYISAIFLSYLDYSRSQFYVLRHCPILTALKRKRLFESFLLHHGLFASSPQCQHVINKAAQNDTSTVNRSPTSTSARLARSYEQS